MARRVLVIEDSEVTQRVIRVCLQSAGLEVATRGDGPSGLEAAVEDPPDLLILDIGLPDMDGWEVLDRLRSHERTREVPVLVLTIHSEEENRQRAARDGANAFMAKPFRLDEFRRIALGLLKSSRQAGLGIA
ncbi:MAG: response regulator [Acidimicrobiia bacterium]